MSYDGQKRRFARTFSLRTPEPGASPVVDSCPEIGSGLSGFYRSFIFLPGGRIQSGSVGSNSMTVKLYPRMESLLRRCVRKIVRTAKAPLWPALSLPLFFLTSSALMDANAEGSPRSQNAYLASSSAQEDEEVAEPAVVKDYLRTTGPAPMRIVAPVVVVRAPRPEFPESEELARDPVAYAERKANGGDAENIRVVAQDEGKGTTISVGGDLLPEVSVSPYSRARIWPEDVVMFFKDEELDGLQGGIAYPAARLRFDPARPDVRGSSSATYTSQ